MNLGSAASRRAIEAALLDYQRSPGKYALGDRKLLPFSAIKEVLQLASGRSPDGDASTGPSAAVQQAACFFIKSALLHPGADHYALLGLPRTVDAGAVKDRYRLMMRLIHPDFSGRPSSTSWPADAATRVNQAYEILSSPQRRGAYDGQSAASPPTPPVGERRTGSRQPSLPATRAAGAKPVAEDPRRRLKRLAEAFGVAGGLGVLALWAAGNQSERESLVQRATAPAPQVAQASPVTLGVLPLPTPVALLPASPLGAPPPAAPEEPPRISSAPYSPVLPPVAPATPAVPAAVPPAPIPTPMPVLSAPATAGPAVVVAAADRGVVPELAMPTAPVAALPMPAVKPPQPGPTMADVHSLLSKLLQEIETGWGDRLLSQLDRDARSEPGAQALLRRYNSVVDGTRPVTLTKVQFRGEPREGRLLVTGRVLIQVRDHAGPPRELVMQAEFASRDGAVVMTRLAQVQE